MIVVRTFVALCVWTVIYIRCIACGSTPAPTMLETFHGNVLKRRIRAVLFAKKTQFIITPAFSKAILGGIPRGLAYTMEFDMYNALPDTVEGWQPTILLKQLDKEKKIEQYQALKETAVMRPGTEMGGLTYNHSDPEAIYYEPLNLGNTEMYQFPFNEDVDSYNAWTYFDSKIDSDTNYFTRQMQNPHIRRSSSAHSPAQLFHKRPFRAKYSMSNKRVGYPYYEAVGSEFNPQTAKTPSNWHHDQNYRERRHIFDQLETVGKLLNINMKSCIQRAMCEMTTHLKPFGESIMEDVLRMILTIPGSSDTPARYANDDYSHRYVNVNCGHRFAASCPYRVMQFLTKALNQNMR